MTRSVKLGVASLALVALSATPPIAGSHTPFSFVFAVISCVLAFLAAQQGSKWWLAVPCILIVVFGLLMWVGFHAS